MQMPSFEMSAHSAAPVEEVWKLLHDPARFPEWWAGIETVQTGEAGGYTVWPSGYPDFPMAQRMGAEHADGRVTISCLVSDLEFVWQLREAAEGTDVDVRVEIPDRESHRLDTQRALLAQSIAELTRLAERVAS